MRDQNGKWLWASCRRANEMRKLGSRADGTIPLSTSFSSHSHAPPAVERYLSLSGHSLSGGTPQPRADQHHLLLPPVSSLPHRKSATVQRGRYNSPVQKSSILNRQSIPLPSRSLSVLRASAVHSHLSLGKSATVTDAPLQFTRSKILNPQSSIHPSSSTPHTPSPSSRPAPPPPGR